MSELINGARTSFGRREVEPKAGAIIPQSLIKTLVLPFNYDDIPAAADALNDATYPLIPAYALLVNAKVYYETAMVGGTSHAIGLAQADGTVIDLDGLFTATELAVANETVNTWVLGSAGALLGVSVGANAAHVYITAVGTYTAGQGKILVEYIEADLPDKA